MIRLLVIQPVAERGGSDQALVRMLRSLPPGGFECHVAVPGEPPLRPALEAAGAEVHVVPMARLSGSHGPGAWARYTLGWPVAVARLVRLVRRLHVDVVVSNSLHSWYGWAVTALTRRPHVWMAREIVVQSGAALRVERTLTRRFATTVVACSQAVADQLPGAPVTVVHETPDPEEFAPARAGRFRAGVGIPDDAPVVGFAGRLDTWKGLDVLLDAFPAVAERVPGAHLVVAGGPVPGKEAYAEALAARAAARDDVAWLGPRDDLPDVLADLDLLVVPSTTPEPYGLVAVEALASGVPVVLTDAGGPREIAALARPGAAVLVAPGDAGALTTAVVDALTRSGSRSTALRRGRTPLQTPEPDRFADLFAAAARRR